jgi:hypothetical protein
LRHCGSAGVRGGCDNEHRAAPRPRRVCPRLARRRSSRDGFQHWVQFHGGFPCRRSPERADRVAVQVMSPVASGLTSLCCRASWASLEGVGGCP